MPLLKNEERERLKEDFRRNLRSEVKLFVFTSAEDCKPCEETVEIVQELQETSDKIKVEILGMDSERAKEFEIERAPTTVITSAVGIPHSRIKFIGVPSGYEFSTLVEDVRRVSRNDPELTPEALSRIQEIDKPLKIRVFVTPTCPYCPKAVRNAHKLALANENITGEMVESSEFPDWVEKWSVYLVPHVVINEDVQFAGDYPDEDFFDYVVQAHKSNGNSSK